MKYFFKFLVVGFIIFLSTSVQAQISLTNNRYEFKKNADHLGVFTNLGFNVGSDDISTEYGYGSAKSAVGVMFLIGGQYQYHFTKTFFIRGELAIGINAHRYKYSDVLKVRSDSTWPEFEKPNNRRSISPLVFKPKIEFGKQFFINNAAILEISVGGSFEKYINKNVDYELDANTSTTTLSNRDRVAIEVSHSKYFGLTKWGVFNAEAYIGFRRLGFNELTERLAIGLTFTMSVDGTTTLGYSDILYYNSTYNYAYGKQTVKMRNSIVGLKLTYDLF